MTNERAIARSGKETGVDESAEDSVARGLIEPPQAARLFDGEAQPRHLEKFSADTMNDVLNPPARLHHRAPNWFGPELHFRA